MRLEKIPALEFAEAIEQAPNLAVGLGQHITETRRSLALIPAFAWTERRVNVIEPQVHEARLRSVLFQKRERFINHPKPSFRSVKARDLFVMNAKAAR